MTENKASSPSFTVTLPTVKSVRSSSVIVPVADARNELSAFLVMVIVNVSVGSGVVSSVVCTVIVRGTPGLSSRVPDLLE